MVQIQGMVRDVTPAAVTGLGGAGNALEGFDQAAAREQQLTQGNDAIQQQRVLFGLSVEKLRQELDLQKQKNEDYRKSRLDMQASNVSQLKALEASTNMDALGPNVRAMWDHLVTQAASASPEAGAELLKAGQQLIGGAQLLNTKRDATAKIQTSLSSGYWDQLEQELGALTGGVDITGDQKPDVAASSLRSIVEGMAQALQSPDADPIAILHDFETMQSALEFERVKLGNRMAAYNGVKQRVEQWVLEHDPAMSQAPGSLLGNLGTRTTTAVPFHRQGEISSMLERFRRGELGDGEGVIYKLRRSVDALLNGKRLIEMPENSPVGPFIEIDADKWDSLTPDEQGRWLGLTDPFNEAVQWAAERVDRLVAAKAIFNDAEARQKLAEFTSWYLNARQGNISALPSQPGGSGSQSGGGPMTPGYAPPAPPKGQDLWAWDKHPDAGNAMVARVSQDAINTLQSMGPVSNQQIYKAVYDALVAMKIDPKTVPADVAKQIQAALGIP